MQIFHPVTVKVKCRRDNFVPLVFAPISCVLLHFWHFAPVFCGSSAFLAFCFGEIFGSQGAEASTGLYYGALEWEIALKLPIVIVPPPSQLPLLCFTFRLKAKMRSRLRCQKILRVIVYRGTGRVPIMSQINHEMPLFHASGPV